MDIKLEGDYLSINILDVLHNLSAQQEQQLIEQLSCSDTVIKHVMDQVLTGSTGGGYSGLVHCSGSYTISNPTALEQARWDIVDKVDDVTRTLIDDMKRTVINSEKLKQEYMDKYFELYHRVS